MCVCVWGGGGGEGGRERHTQSPVLCTLSTERTVDKPMRDPNLGQSSSAGERAGPAYAWTYVSMRL